MPIYTPSGFLDITNATLRTSNIESQNINFTGSGGSISVGPAFDFQQVSAIGNTTPETIQFTNATTSFVTSGNVEVGKNISVVDANVSSNMSVGGNVTVSSNLSVSGNVTIGKNLFLTSNTTTSINSNVIVEHSGPHPREPTTPLLKKFPEVDFDASKMDGNDTANTYVEAGYVVTASSQNSGSEVWRLFDDGDWNQEAINKYTTASSFQYNPSSNPNSLGDVSGEWFKVKFPRKVIINKFTLNVGDIINNGLAAFKVLGSDDDTNWTEVKDVSGLTSASYTTAAPFVTTVESVSSEAYRYYAVVITQLLGVNQVTIREVEFYGYEEDLPAGDTSLDTTFTSILNRPQTSGVKVYVDGDTLDNKVTGPTPTSTGATYDSTGKYWSITSNVTVEANTFLEGDAPHSVSMWFNSSNLEANVSNTCVFSVSDQEHLNSENLDLQSNTWHNLTYAYQGEGGSRVTYLDGRKVSEDQAEDTFGEYPPFAMTGYSQGGYVVSSNHTRSGYYPYDAFDNETNDDDTTSSRWWSSADVFSGYVYNGSTSDQCGTFQGVYLKLELPYKLICSHVNLWLRDYNNGTTPNPQSPKDFKIIGSNDDINWVELKDEVSFVDTGNVAHPVIVNATKGYKYLAIVVTRVNSSTLVSIMDVEYYGHRENDLVRLPDPTNVLKYPHVNFGNEPARRGYVISASGEYQDGADSNHRMWRPFQNLSGDGSWLTDDSPATFDNASPDSAATNANSLSGIVGVSGSRNGPWLKLELPHKIKFSYAHIYKRNHPSLNPGIKTGFIYGSNDDSTWTTIGTINESSPSYTATTPLIVTSTDTTNAYKYIVIQVTLMDQQNSVFGLGQLEYYGTEEATSIPIQIGGGNIDRVANFRVYDKFIGEDQALEIWDAQKDTFRGVKNSMTLHKGYLGLGTTEPEGRLAILDEPHNLEEFPPRAMTDYETYFEGHGVFKASASSEYTTTPRLAWKAFNKSSENIDDGWMIGVAGYGGASSGTASGTTPTHNGTEFLGGIGGEWISLEFPYKVKLNGLKITSYFDGTFRGLNDGFLLGRNDKNSEWTRVYEITNLYAVYGVRDTAQLSAEISFTNDTYYNEYALIATSTTGHSNWTAMELKYFGTREQRQSVLHDGQLTLTKNLDVPRIGPPLDADDTPRRDRLVVEYNTSSNPTFEGAVRDTSGRGNDGAFYGGASYSATDKALKFTKAGTTVSGTSTQWTEVYIGDGSFFNNQLAVSFWSKIDENVDTSTHYAALFALGDRSQSGDNTEFSIFYNHVSQSREDFFVATVGGSNNINLYHDPDVSIGLWYHLTATFNGSEVKFYVNGSLTGTASLNILNIPKTNCVVRLNGDAISANSTHQGQATSLSNFKLYDVALTAQEVKTLYDMGRLGNAIKTPLQIEAPVDIRGDIRYITNIRPLPKQTMWDHESNGHFTRGIYPITGTQGGSKVYNMLCEPDWCGGGWMCAAQLPNGKDVVTTPVNLFTAEYGDPSNLTWSNDFAVPMNIFSNDSGYDLDVMLVLLGGTQAGRAGAGGARNGGIYRGVNLTQALNTGWPTNGVYPANISTSGLASSADGYNFVSRTPSGYNFQPYKANGGWRLSFSSLAGNDMAYNDADINTMGWLVHTVGNVIHYTYSYVHGGGGAQNQSGGNTSWAAVRFFVRPKRY